MSADRDLLSPETYTPPENVPIRFLAMRWDAGWEFDNPIVLLEPVFRYSPNGGSGESIIEDVIIDILVDEVVRTGPSGGDLKEFTWRGWSLSRLRRIARQSLGGKKFPIRGYRAIEQWAVFFRNAEGELTCRDVDRHGQELLS